MDITYTYKIKELQRDSSDIIIAASFTITANDGIDEFTHNYHTAFPAPKNTPIKFSKITEDNVINWIKNIFTSESKNSLEDQALNELYAYKERKQVKTGLPW